MTKQSKREALIVRTSILGIIVNIMLVIFKATVGFLSQSIAIILDSVNNLSDALSSIITIIGTKLANRKPDKKHPLGHGRIEFLTSTIIAVIILYAGITALIESIKKIIHPTEPKYTFVTLLVIAVGVAVKYFLGQYVKKQGEITESDALIASGADALFDAVLSFSVLVSAIIMIVFHVNVEAYVGLVIAVIIIKSGYEILMESLDNLLGTRIDSSITKEVKQIIASDEDVYGAYDLVLHNYGPNKLLGSVHVEVPDTLSAHDIDVMTRRIQENVYKETGIFLNAIGIYSKNTENKELKEMEDKIHSIVFSHENVLQMHGFYANQEEKKIRFDIIISFESEDIQGQYKTICKEVQEAYPDYDVSITLDNDITE